MLMVTSWSAIVKYMPYIRAMVKHTNDLNVEVLFSASSLRKLRLSPMSHPSTMVFQDAHHTNMIETAGSKSTTILSKIFGGRISCSGTYKRSVAFPDQAFDAN